MILKLKTHLEGMMADNKLSESLLDQMDQLGIPNDEYEQQNITTNNNEPDANDLNAGVNNTSRGEEMLNGLSMLESEL